jgi:hypothetical protein
MRINLRKELLLKQIVATLTSLDLLWSASTFCRRLDWCWNPNSVAPSNCLNLSHTNREIEAYLCDNRHLLRGLVLLS